MTPASVPNAPGAADTLAVDVVPELEALGARALVTRRDAGTFSTASDEPISVVMGRWDALARMLGVRDGRLATSRQIHGARILRHEAGWTGWLRAGDADGHHAPARGTAMAISVADCVPVFLVHASGAAALLHAGWRGTAAGILEHGLSALAADGIRPAEVTVYLGPAICGACYEVGPEVIRAITGRQGAGPERLDLRGELARRAHAAGAREIITSPFCTRCDNDRYFSHRAGDRGRQVAALVVPA
ncbi:MAG TPA: polyphenol oxidase family protein [Gemmatimonadaceae bacterium]|nr:polyphenol oxidase family protein [Gemmatimonadaceae bacterium]